MARAGSTHRLGKIIWSQPWHRRDSTTYPTRRSRHCAVRGIETRLGERAIQSIEPSGREGVEKLIPLLARLESFYPRGTTSTIKSLEAVYWLSCMTSVGPDAKAGRFLAGASCWAVRQKMRRWSVCWRVSRTLRNACHTSLHPIR